jgi:Na+/H+ antiporter NhaD/arsenite permease-like protein
VKYLIIGLAYLGLALGHVPGLRMNRATIALVASGLLIGLGAISLEDAWQAIDAETIVFLLSMMIVNASLTYAGFFQVALAGLVGVTGSPFGLLVTLTIGSGVLSAVFLNDTIALILTPLILKLAQATKLNPVPYLLALAGATNIGSVATLSGNPQNILIGSFSQIPYLDFARSLTPIALIGLVMQIGLLWWMYPDVRSTQAVEHFSLPKTRILKPLFLKAVLITTGLLIAFVAGLPLAESAIVAASLVLITRRIKPDRILMDVDWNLLVMFSGLFILTKATQNLNILTPLTQMIHGSATLLGITALLSNIVSNVPAVLLLHPLINPHDSQAWLLLAAGSTLAGNLTIFGSVANLIVVEASASFGYRLSFLEHLRFGLPLTLLTLGFAYLWLQNVH